MSDTEVIAVAKSKNSTQNKIKKVNHITELKKLKEDTLKTLNDLNENLDEIESKINDSDNVNSLSRHINKKKVVKVKSITKVTETKTTKEINHEIVNYNDINYIVCCIPFNDDFKMFVCDIDKYDEFIKRSWHYRIDGHYIASTYITDDEINNKKELYLHNFVMNKLTFDGKGQQHTIDHINRIGTDNRKVNLREANSQSAQNLNQQKRERKTELPENSGLSVNDIPKNIYYGKPNGNHGDFFYIEIKGIPTMNNGKFVWKSTKSKSVLLKLKLQQTIDKLSNLKDEYPELKNILVDEESDNIRKELIEQYNDILKLSHYPKSVIEANLRDFTGEYIKLNLNTNIDELEKVNKIKESGKKTDKLPPDSGLTIDMIPKYCYFKPESDKRGCKFVIERHPKLIEQGSRSWSTTESKKVSILDKFNLLMDKLKELEI
jgi:hypothetical protein